MRVCMVLAIALTNSITMQFVVVYFIYISTYRQRTTCMNPKRRFPWMCLCSKLTYVSVVRVEIVSKVCVCMSFVYTNIIIGSMFLCDPHAIFSYTYLYHWSGHGYYVLHQVCDYLTGVTIDMCNQRQTSHFSNGYNTFRQCEERIGSK